MQYFINMRYFQLKVNYIGLFNNHPPEKYCHKSRYQYKWIGSNYNVLLRYVYIQKACSILDLYLLSQYHCALKALDVILMVNTIQKQYQRLTTTIYFGQTIIHLIMFVSIFMCLGFYTKNEENHSTENGLPLVIRRACFYSSHQHKRCCVTNVFFLGYTQICRHTFSIFSFLQIRNQNRKIREEIVLTCILTIPNGIFI